MTIFSPRSKRCIWFITKTATEVIWTKKKSPFSMYDAVPHSNQTVQSQQSEFFRVCCVEYDAFFLHSRFLYAAVFSEYKKRLRAKPHLRIDIDVRNIHTQCNSSTFFCSFYTYIRVTRVSIFFPSLITYNFLSFFFLTFGKLTKHI